MIMPNPEHSTLAAYQSGFKRKEKSRVICSHCGKSGHTKDKCYRIIGFPTSFKFTKSKGNFNTSGGGSHSANQVATQTQNQEKNTIDVLEIPFSRLKSNNSLPCLMDKGYKLLEVQLTSTNPLQMP